MTQKFILIDDANHKNILVVFPETMVHSDVRVFFFSDIPNESIVGAGQAQVNEEGYYLCGETITLGVSAKYLAEETRKWAAKLYSEPVYVHRIGNNNFIASNYNLSSFIEKYEAYYGKKIQCYRFENDAFVPVNESDPMSPEDHAFFMGQVFDQW